MTYPTPGVQNAIGPVGMMCPEALRGILDPSFPFPQKDTALWNSEDFLKMTYPTRGGQNAIGPVGMMCPEALWVILGSIFPFFILKAFCQKRQLDIPNLYIVYHDWKVHLTHTNKEYIGQYGMHEE